MILYWIESNDPELAHGDHFQIRFFCYPLWQFQEPTTEFTQLSELRTGRFRDWLTAVVKGLICVCDSNMQLTVYNVCTGQGMRLPDPTRYDLNQSSSFHLGYDPINKIYKLLRVFHAFRRTRYCTLVQINPTLQAEILSLAPSGSVSTWRKLDSIACGILDLMAWQGPYSRFESSVSGDGIIWLSGKRSLLSFDLKKEKFQLIAFPEDINNEIDMHKFDFSDSRPHGYILTQSMGRPALWVKTDNLKCLMLFVLENEEANTWSKHRVQFPNELGEADVTALEAGNLSTGELLLMNEHVNDGDGCRTAYSYNHLTSNFNRFVIRKYHEKLDYRVLCSNEKLIDDSAGRAKISCVHDNNLLHLPLDDVLGGAF